MKRILITLFSLCAIIGSMVAQGWPSQYGGVMLQGFYWGSYADTQWTHLESPADEMS